MSNNKKKKKKNKLQYDYESFFLDDVLKEIKSNHKQKKKSGLTC